jgi:hypothetical protein
VIGDADILGAVRMGETATAENGVMTNQVDPGGIRDCRGPGYRPGLGSVHAHFNGSGSVHAHFNGSGSGHAHFNGPDFMHAHFNGSGGWARPDGIEFDCGHQRP